MYRFQARARERTDGPNEPLGVRCRDDSSRIVPIGWCNTIRHPLLNPVLCQTGGMVTQTTRNSLHDVHERRFLPADLDMLDSGRLGYISQPTLRSDSADSFGDAREVHFALEHTIGTLSRPNMSRMHVHHAQRSVLRGK